MLKAVKLILTLKCEESTRLVSESRDRELPFAERWAVRLHAVSCRPCRRYAKQLRFLASVLKRYAGDADVAPEIPAALSDDARNRIQQAIISESDRDA